MKKLLSFLILLTTSVSAEFTTQEKTQVLKVFQASVKSTTGQRYITTAAARVPVTDTVTQSKFKDLLTKAVANNRELSNGIANLLGTSSEQPTAIPTTSRTKQLEQWYFFRDRVVLRLNESQIILIQLQLLYLTDTIYQDAVNRARTIWYQSTLGDLTSFDATLSYLSPLPASAHPLPLGSVITLVGPHGDYMRTTWRIFHAKKYAHDAFSEHLLPIYTGASTWLSAYNSYTNIIDVIDKGLRIFVSIYNSTAEATEDRFCQILKINRDLTITTPFRYEQMFQVLGTGSINRLGDSWKHNDLGVWEMLDFPNSPRCPEV